MTFETFEDYRSWVEGIEEINTETIESDKPEFLIRDIHDSKPMIICEIMVSAYDSGFHFGGMFTNEKNGCLVIYKN